MKKFKHAEIQNLEFGRNAASEAAMIFFFFKVSDSRVCPDVGKQADLLNLVGQPYQHIHVMDHTQYSILMALEKQAQTPKVVKKGLFQRQLGKETQASQKNSYLCCGVYLQRF